MFKKKKAFIILFAQEKTNQLKNYNMKQTPAPKRSVNKKARRNAKKKAALAAVDATNPRVPTIPNGVNGVGGTGREDAFLKKLGIEVTFQRWMRKSNNEIVGKGSDGLVYGMKEEVHTCQGVTAQVLKIHEASASVLIYEGEDSASPPVECDAVSNMSIRKLGAALSKKQRRAPEGTEPRITQMRIDDGSIKSGDALNEAMVHRACSLCSEKNFTPHITMCSRAAWNPRSLEAYMWLERYDFTLDSFAQSHLRWWTKERFCAMFFQIFHTVYVMQEVLQLKHHDLHDQNVAIKRIDNQTLFRGEALKHVTHFMYNIGEQQFFVPNIGYLVKLSDFGFANVSVGGKRMQRIDLPHFNDNPSKYGTWDSDLEDKHGYDLQVLLASYCTPSLKTLCSKNKEIATLMRTMYTTVLGPKGRNTKSQRPMPNHVSDVRPADAICSLFGKGGNCQSFLSDPRDTNSSAAAVVIADMTINQSQAAAYFDEFFENV